MEVGGVGPFHRGVAEVSVYILPTYRVYLPANLPLQGSHVDAGYTGRDLPSARYQSAGNNLAQLEYLSSCEHAVGRGWCPRLQGGNR